MKDSPDSVANGNVASTVPHGARVFLWSAAPVPKPVLGAVGLRLPETADIDVPQGLHSANIGKRVTPTPDPQTFRFVRAVFQASACE
jgi:hypothetical protein